MKKDAESFETGVLESVRQILRDWSLRLDEVGLRTDVIGPKRSLTGVEYASEVEIRFSDENGIVDVLEFFLYQEGQQAASRSAIETWFEQNVEDVLRRRKTNRSAL